jgi:predicted GIY-YIG superfamily endonuclease
MTFVYILQSIAFPERFYAGVTADVSARLEKHNAGDVTTHPNTRRGTSTVIPAKAGIQPSLSEPSLADLLGPRPTSG